MKRQKTFSVKKAERKLEFPGEKYMGLKKSDFCNDERVYAEYQAICGRAARFGWSMPLVFLVRVLRHVVRVTEYGCFFTDLKGRQSANGEVKVQIGNGATETHTSSKVSVPKLWGFFCTFPEVDPAKWDLKELILDGSHLDPYSCHGPHTHFCAEPNHMNQTRKCCHEFGPKNPNYKCPHVPPCMWDGKNENQNC